MFISNTKYEENNIKMSNQTSKKFGSFQDLSTSTKERIENVIDSLDRNSITYNIYYGYPVIDEKNKKDFVKGIIICKKGIFILYENDNEKNTYVSRIVQLISQDSELYGEIWQRNYLFGFNMNNDENLLNIYLGKEDIFDDIIIKQVNRAIQTAYGLSREDNRETHNNNSIGSKIKKRNTYIGTFDEKQFNMIHSDDNKNIRIRGLAGSGKTILLAKKMAYLHYKHPKKNIAFIFYTVSLTQTIIELFKKYYKDYNRYDDPDFTKINILHAWGGVGKKGFYYEFTNKTDNKFFRYQEALESKGNEEAFEFVCRNLLENIEENNANTKFYDYVFVDEAQDFKINFFKLARKSLKEGGRLIYAYDELQSLSEENSIPTKNEIFGEDECIDINLNTSYRAPVEVLTTAHALGLGIYRNVDNGELPFVNMIRDKEVWLGIGYEESDGTLQYGEYVELSRNEERLSENGIINTFSFENDEDQYEKLANIIIDLLKNEDVCPEDILIIDLSHKLKTNHAKFRQIFNSFARRESLFSEGTDHLAFTINLVDKENPTRMKLKNAIPYTTIYRAKGNEANLVFIVNSDSLEIVKSISRNKIFTAMTRARYAVWLMGMKTIAAFEDEIEKVKSNNYKLCFTYPTEEELDKIKTYGAVETLNEYKIKGLADNILELKQHNPEMTRKLLLELLKDMGD